MLIFVDYPTDQLRIVKFYLFEPSDNKSKFTPVRESKTAERKVTKLKFSKVEPSPSKIGSIIFIRELWVSDNFSRFRYPSICSLFIRWLLPDK